jgi:hypothetical protein
MSIIKRMEASNTPPMYTNDNIKIWGHLREDGVAFFHREDGPAVIHVNGTQEWWQNGQLHREDGPAIICADGSQVWYMNNRRHREDGPAYIHPTRYFTYYEWWVNGEFIRLEQVPQVLIEDGE